MSNEPTEVMKSEKRVWTRRWKELRDAGLTWHQARTVFDLLNTCHAFGYEWLAVSAFEQLQEVYADVRD